MHYQTGQIEIKSTSHTGRMGLATWDAQTVLDVAMTGSLPHGGYEKGTAIWTKSQATIATLGGVYKMIERELTAIGVPIRK